MASVFRLLSRECRGDLVGDVGTLFLIGFLQTPLIGIQLQDVERWRPWLKIPSHTVVLYPEGQG
jgi:hypothetical protein